MAVMEKAPQVDAQGAPSLGPGPRWDSFERFRASGSKGLQARIGEGQVARLNVKGDEFVIMRAATFNRLYGSARDAGRLRRGLLLIRQAVQLALHTDGSRTAVEHLRDLIHALPDMHGEPVAPSGELVFDGDERADDEADATSVEIDPAKVRRPSFGRAG